MRRTARPRRAGRNIGTATAVVSLTLVAGASAGGGGTEPTEPPRVSDVHCIETCAGTRKATAGSRVELTGSHLRGVRKVLFDGEGGGRVGVDPLDASRRAVKARVPAAAVSGRPRVTDGAGGADTSPERLEIVAAEEVPDDGGFELRKSSASPEKAFYYSRRDARLTYSFGGETTDVRILVAKKSTDRVVRTIVQHDREPFVEHTVTWNGRTNNGNTAGNGKYRFKVGARSGSAVDSGPNAVFGYYNHKFPLRAPHSYGDGIGAGRGHQGQDVFASCGSRLVAARGGRVQWKQYHSAAGYYLVIDGKGNGRDYAYMHMLRKGRPSEGSRVRTGERIGFVSDTGNASGCHLHFEIWSPPGWYEGGHPTNPTDDLKAWDSWS